MGEKTLSTKQCEKCTFPFPGNSKYKFCPECGAAVSSVPLTKERYHDITLGNQKNKGSVADNPRTLNIRIRCESEFSSDATNRERKLDILATILDSMKVNKLRSRVLIEEYKKRF